jgi:hypothetical protein
MAKKSTRLHVVPGMTMIDQTQMIEKVLPVTSSVQLKYLLRVDIIQRESRKYYEIDETFY